MEQNPYSPTILDGLPLRIHTEAQKEIAAFKDYQTAKRDADRAYAHQLLLAKAEKATDKAAESLAETSEEYQEAQTALINTNVAYKKAESDTKLLADQQDNQKKFADIHAKLLMKGIEV